MVTTSSANNAGVLERLTQNATSLNGTIATAPETCTSPSILGHSHSHPSLEMQVLRVDHNEEINRVTRELWDTRREIAAALARESSLSDSLRSYGVNVPESLSTSEQMESDNAQGKTLLPCYYLI